MSQGPDCCEGSQSQLDHVCSFKAVAANCAQPASHSVWCGLDSGAMGWDERDQDSSLVLAVTPDDDDDDDDDLRITTQQLGIEADRMRCFLRFIPVHFTCSARSRLL